MLHELRTPELDGQLPAQAVEDLLRIARLYIEERYDNPPDGRQELTYHGLFHTNSVISRVERILRAIQSADATLVSERDIQLGRVAAAFHDVVQQWGPAEGNNAGMPTTIMKRKTGFNEKASAHLSAYFMSQVKSHNGKEVFSAQDVALVQEAILGTIPGFDVQLRTVVQPNVSADSSLITKALALADLGGPGMEGPLTYKWEGDSLFREMNLDLKHWHANGVPIPHQYQESVRNRALEWTASQAEFAYGRAVRFYQTELLWLPEHVRPAVEAEFAFYHESVQSAEDILENRSSLNCNEILADMGYN